MSHPPLAKKFTEQLIARFGPLGFSQDPELLKIVGKDWTAGFESKASCVVYPRGPDEVAYILKLCSEFKVAVVPSGGRTGLAAGAVAQNGELVLSLDRCNHISAPDLTSGTLRVQAGAVTEAVQQALEPFDLTWPIDLASKGSSQIGGNIATNAGGLRVIRYGHTRHWVQSLEIVLMSGDILEVSGNLEKNNTGYDLRQLLIGSEGTLAVVTAATLKITKLERDTTVLLFGIESAAKALWLLSECRKKGLILCAFEFMSQACTDLVQEIQNAQLPFNTKSPYYALLEIEQGDINPNLLSFLSEAIEKSWVLDGVRASSAAERAHIWSLRENITESLRSKGTVFKNDLSLPLAKLDSFISDLEAKAPTWYPGSRLFLFGHLGDGNIHVNVLNSSQIAPEEFLKNCDAANSELYSLVARAGGSIAAEHGIGLLKRDWLKFSRSPKEIEIFRQIKKSFDPQGLLNPGKIFV